MLLYDSQEQSVQHSLRPQQHRPNMQSGAHQNADVCVNDSPRRPSLRSSFQRDAGQIRATGHHLSPAAASSSPIVRRQTALPYAVVIDQHATLFERLDSRFWKPYNRGGLTSRLIRSLTTDVQEQLAAALVQLPVPKQEISTVVTFRVVILKFYVGGNGQDTPGERGTRDGRSCVRYSISRGSDKGGSL